MTNLLRMTLAASVAALTLTSAPAAAAPTGSSNGAATARARIVKPLTLTRTANMDFGDIVVQDAGVATLTMGGALSCTGGLTCATTGTAAAYLVTGTNNQVVTVTAPDVSLINAANPGTPLTLDLTAPTTVTLPNSGATGFNFSVGGSIAVAASTRDGVYNGDLNVTVDYQ
jgi:hypothetical protein